MSSQGSLIARPRWSITPGNNPPRAPHDKRQAIEIDVGAREHSDQARAGGTLLAHVADEPGHGQRASRLDDDARVVEDLAHRGADLVSGDAHDAIDNALCHAEGILAHFVHGYTICKPPNSLETDSAAGAQGPRHRICIHRLHANHGRLWRDRFHVSANAGYQASTADRHEYGCERPGLLLEQFLGHGALAGDNERVVEWV